MPTLCVVENLSIAFGSPKTYPHLSLGIHGGLVPGPLWLPKPEDGQVPYTVSPLHLQMGTLGLQRPGCVFIEKIYI